jgi:hypothetical protein
MSVAHDLLNELRVVIQDAKTTAYATFSSHARPVANMLRVYGTLNSAHVDFNARTLVLERSQSIPSAVGRLLPPFLVAKDYFRQGYRNVGRFHRARFHFFDGMRELLTRFYSSIANDSDPPIRYRDILLVARTMETIFSQIYPRVFA